MRTLLLLIFLTSTLRTQAQTSVYHPFPDSNAVWNVDLYQYIYTPQCTLAEFQYSYIITGDTVINGLTYHKLWTPHLDSIQTCAGFGSFLPVGYRGSYRHDVATRKVFFIPPNDSAEQLLYDFSLQIGDTIKGYLGDRCSLYNPTTITGIDSIMVGNNYRKRWGLNIGTNIIEGIGSEYDLFADLCFIICNCGTSLMCFTQNNYLIFRDSTFYFSPWPCDVITSINYNLIKENNISISPNPFHTTATLEIKNKEFSNAELKIYDRMGRLVQRQIINSPSTIIHRNSLADGIYFYQLISNKGQMLGGKFVVE